MMYRVGAIAASSALALALAGCDGDGSAQASSPGMFQVTIQNLTDGQPFSGGVLVTHAPAVSVWRLGRPASAGITLIAEDGMPGQAVADLGATSGVTSVVQTGPIARVGGPATGMGPGTTSRTFQIAADEDDVLSQAAMIICTNDGFTGLDSVALPDEDQGSITYYTQAYDAGTERNTEAFVDIVDPCQAAGPVNAASDGNNGAGDTSPPGPDGDVIMGHDGISGGGDLVEDTSAFDHEWGNPVARVTIVRQ